MCVSMVAAGIAWREMHIISLYLPPADPARFVGKIISAEPFAIHDVLARAFDKKAKREAGTNGAEFANDCGHGDLLC